MKTFYTFFLTIVMSTVSINARSAPGSPRIISFGCGGDVAVEALEVGNYIFQSNFAMMDKAARSVRDNNIAKVIFAPGLEEHIWPKGISDPTLLNIADARYMEWREYGRIFVYWTKNPGSKLLVDAVNYHTPWMVPMYNISYLRGDWSEEELNSYAVKEGHDIFLTPEFKDTWLQREAQNDIQYIETSCKAAPIIFISKHTGLPVLLNLCPDHLYAIHQWEVLNLATYNGNKASTCQIELWAQPTPNFAHEKAVDKDIIPEGSILELAKLIDNVFIGKSSVEYQRELELIGGLRHRAGYAWMLLYIRPWALYDPDWQPPNAREEVDAHLRRFAQKGRYEHKFYSQLLRLYSGAEAELALYYSREFDKSVDEAAQMAHQLLDIVFRHHFSYK